MNQLYKGKAKNILAWLSATLLALLTMHYEVSIASSNGFHISLTRDTIPPKKKKQAKDSISDIPLQKIIRSDSGKVNRKVTDTTLTAFNDTITYKKSGNALTAPVAYHADDSMVFDVPGKRLILYGKVSKVSYEDNELTAPLIEYDQQTSLVKAYLKKDSTGREITYPAYSQGDFKTKSDTIVYNMKTGKGLTKGTYTQQGEMYVYGEKIKKIDKDVFYAQRARFTTCNLDTPHFAFISNKIKFINKKTAYSGPVHPEFESVPIPVYLPFGIFPMSQGRHSGLIAPSFTANDQQGLALEGLGY